MNRIVNVINRYEQLTEALYLECKGCVGMEQNRMGMRLSRRK